MTRAPWVTHFGFTRTPFSKNIPAKDLLERASHQEAVARIRFCIAESMLGVVTGEVGVGKTVAVRAAVSQLDQAAHHVVYLANPTVGTRGLYVTIVRALGAVPRGFKAELIAQAQDLLAAEEHERRRRVVLLVDEAHLLDPHQLEEDERRWKSTAATPCAPSVEPVFFPLDEELELLPGELSATLAEGVARLGTKLPFEQAAAELAFFWGVELDETTVRQHTYAAGAAYLAEQADEVARLERERPVAPAGPDVQYLSAMMPLVGGEWAEVKTLAIGDVELRRGADGLPEAHTTNLTYFSRLADAETFTHQAYVEAYQRGTESAGVVCAVQDGAEWLQGLVDVLRPDAVRILDFPHAVEHLTAAAQASLGIGTQAFTTWLDQQAHTLKHAVDGVRQVLAALAHLPVQAAVDPIAAAQARDGAIAYFTKRLVQVQYAAFQVAGYPIGSGSTESANKVVVEVRLKGSGMHWAREHVNPLVALRTVACANRWAEVWPRISARLRSEAKQRRRARWRARHPTPATPPTEHPPTPATIAVTPPASANPAPASRGKSVVNGRPTALHPWKRYDRFASGRRPQGRPR